MRFRAKNNPIPSKTTHNTLIEFIWITVPIIILGCIFIPSLRIHYYMDKAPSTEKMITLKVVGYQWYWGYEYPDNGDISYESHIHAFQRTIWQPRPETDQGRRRQSLNGQPRLLTGGRTRRRAREHECARAHTTASDVIHSWSVPAFGVKMDAIPGRVNETWFKATQIGTYRGQCSQLCGVWHGFMPVVVKVVSQEDFDAWVAAKKGPAAETPAQPQTGKPAEVPTGAASPATPAQPNAAVNPPAAAPAPGTPSGTPTSPVAAKPEQGSDKK